MVAADLSPEAQMGLGYGLLLKASHELCATEEIPVAPHEWATWWLEQMPRTPRRVWLAGSEAIVRYLRAFPCRGSERAAQMLTPTAVEFDVGIGLAYLHAQGVTGRRGATGTRDSNGGRPHGN